MLNNNFKSSVLVFTILFIFSLHVNLFSQDYKLVWSDEFEGDKLDGTKWEIQTGNGNNGWGNKELQYYQSENATVNNGFLTITAKKESIDTCKYTSSRIRTKDKGDWKYGKIEMRAKMPIGQGIWPAFWMMPTENVYGTWAASGEIDIMEFLGHEPHKIYGTLHYEKWPTNKHTGTFFESKVAGFHEDFHTFSVIWEEGKIEWYIDDLLFQTQTEWSTEGHKFPAPFDQKFHIILNLAVGGNWPQYPDSSTIFPQDYIIDYVRVYQKDSEE